MASPTLLSGRQVAGSGPVADTGMDWLAPGPARGGRPSRPPVVRQPRSARSRSRVAPLRLTRRGRIVVILVGVIVLFAAFTAGRSSSAAPTAVRPALSTVVVQPGQTLWDVAAAVAPGEDRRATVERLLRLNSLTHTALRPGQSLRVASG